MVLRVTNQMQQNNALQNIFRIREDLFRANERIATGRRINRPSDDPSGIRLASSLTVSISQAEQFSRNIGAVLQRKKCPLSSRKGSPSVSHSLLR